MIGKLIYFEITKKWRTVKYLLLGYAGIQTLLLLVIRLFFWNEGIAEELTIDIADKASQHANVISASFILTMVVFFLLAAFLGAYPFIEGIYRFERDLSGKQAYLELMIPAVSWKKVFSKLIATLCSLIVFGTVSLLSIFLFFAVNGNINGSFFEIVWMGIKEIWNDGPKVLILLLFILFSFASFYMIIFFCISIAKSFTHKNTVAIPIGILAFIVVTALISALSMQLEKVPIIEYSIMSYSSSLSTTISQVLIFIAALAGTSWLMEKRIEH